jgi:DNA-binding LacI/PurR family transcriptional regulator
VDVARVTLKTVAERVGVSSMTVSNAFSRPDQLSAALRERILAVAAELGYVGPDPAARTLARGTTGTVGILVTDSLHYVFTDVFSATFLASIAEELAGNGLALTILPPDGTGTVVPTRDVAMDAAIVYSCGIDADGLGWLRKRGLPLVQVDQPFDPAVTSINIEDRAGAEAAARHVVDLGHRRVAVVVVGAGDPTTDGGSHQEQRMLGWLDALAPAGVEPVVVHCAVSAEDDAVDAVSELLARPDRPTALLCFSDALAAGALRAARAAGLDVPTDLTVVGFDDSPLARRTDPPLTTVRQDAVAKGRAAAAAVVDALDRRRAGQPAQVEHVVLPAELVVRASSAPPR